MNVSDSLRGANVAASFPTRFQLKKKRDEEARERTVTQRARLVERRTSPRGARRDFSVEEEVRREANALNMRNRNAMTPFFSSKAETLTSVGWRASSERRAKRTPSATAESLRCANTAREALSDDIAALKKSAMRKRAKRTESYATCATR